MTVKELEIALDGIKNKDQKVVMAGYYNLEVNGYYEDTKEDENVLILTHLNVQPRITD